MVLKGRLGLETARVPHADRHGLLWLERGRISVENGTLLFSTAGNDNLASGAYEIPFQQISCLLLGPGTVISHDALRLLARQKTGVLAVGSKGIRLYASSMPFGPDRSALARKQARLWSNEKTRIDIVRKMYSLRFDDPLPGSGSSNRREYIFRTISIRVFSLLHNLACFLARAERSGPNGILDAYKRMPFDPTARTPVF